MRQSIRASVVVLMAILVLGVGPTVQQEHFGSFLDRLKGAFDPERQPRPVFRLENDFRFQDPNGLLWLAPAGIEVDGASIPQFLWSVIGGPFEGPYISAQLDVVGWSA